MRRREFDALPETLYHAAPQCAEDAIKRQGLRSVWGEVYLTTDPQHCLRFMGTRLLAHLHDGFVKHEVNGEMVMFPNVVQHDYVPVFGVIRETLDYRNLFISDDHDPAFYGADVISLVYRSEEITPNNLRDYVNHFA